MLTKPGNQHLRFYRIIFQTKADDQYTLFYKIIFQTQAHYQTGTGNLWQELVIRVNLINREIRMAPIYFFFNQM